MPIDENASFGDLHLLTVLAGTRSFTQAALRLGISKSSVSARITDLERMAGVPLVRRTTRAVTLTNAGQQLVEETRDAFAAITHSFTAVRDLAGHPRGLLRLTAPVALGRQVVAPALSAFLHRYPEVSIELDLNDRLVNLAHEGFDLAIRHAHATPETYIAWELCKSSTVLVAHSEYLRQRGLPQHPGELEQHACLTYLRDQASPHWLFERTDDTGAPERVQVSIRAQLRANNSEVLREAVLSGLGIAVLPDFTVRAHLEPDQLVQLLPQWRPLATFGGAIYAIRPWTPRVPLAVRCLVDHLRALFADGTAHRVAVTRS